MADTITYQRHEPFIDLKKYISYYWYMENEAEEEQAYPDLLIPDGYPEIIFILEGAYHKRPLIDESQVAIVNSSSVVGIQHQSLLVKRMGKVRLFGIKFKPMGFYRFFGPMAARTLGHTLSLHEFDIPYLLELEGSLRKSESPDKAVARIDHTLDAHKSGLKYSKKEDVVQECINGILETQGNMGLNELSAKVGKGKRQIQRYFKECVGLSPKRFSKLIRFKSVYKKDVLSETSLGHFFDHGYFDQSHFIKDFRANLGTTPSHTSSHKFRAQNRIAKKSMRP
ncbi:AraC family transcriptional regulator [Spongiimicrobium sp. 2-473A-2-J]|uniref:AraC family transcriptional regulator n=1 Tax=Eudoraea algarum TaxID=3417568 RepID=UPI003D35D2CD